MSWGSSGLNTSSRRMRSTSAWTRRYRRFWSSTARLVGLVGARGVEPPGSTLASVQDGCVALSLGPKVGTRGRGDRTGRYAALTAGDDVARAPVWTARSSYPMMAAPWRTGSSAREAELTVVQAFID